MPSELIDKDFVSTLVTGVAKSLLKHGRIRNVLPEEAYTLANEKPLQADISAVIAVCYKHFEGLVALSFPAATFDKLTMISEKKHTAFNASEFINLVSADTVSALKAHGYTEESPYAVAILNTPKHTAAPPSTKRSLVAPFDSDAGKFFIQFFLNH